MPYPMGLNRFVEVAWDVYGDGIQGGFGAVGSLGDGD